VDAAVSSPERARQLVAAGAARVVVGLETLPSFDALARLLEPSGRRASLSRSISDGVPLAHASLTGTPLEMARGAVTAAPGDNRARPRRIGGGRAWTWCWWSAAARVSHVELLAAAASAHRATSSALPTPARRPLIASALHDGGIKREDVAAVRRTDHPSDSR